MKRLQVTVMLIGDEKCVFFNHKLHKKFNIIDDYAYTNSKNYADSVRRMTPEEQIENYPEYFL